MKTRLIALFCVLGLLASACGSRLSDDELSTGGGTGSGSSSSSGGGGGSGKDGEGISNDTPDGPMMGSLSVPCGEAPEGGNGPLADGVVGASDDTIQLAVISDVAGPIKLPTASVQESTQAFVKWCNGFGGINGRTLELTPYDAKLTAADKATQQACDQKPLALVGSGSVLDDKGAQIMVDCGLIEVPAYTATAKKALSDNLVQPLPNPSNLYNISAAQYVAAEHPKAIKKAGIIASDLPTATIQADRIIEAYESVGFEFIYRENAQAIGKTSYAAEAKAMKDKGVEWVGMVSATSETTKLLKDMKAQGFEPEVIDLGQQYYDTDLLAEPASEGAIVQMNTTPFEEVDESPALQAYLAAYDDLGTKVQPTALGVQAFSAGLLFATAAKAAGDDLTRENVLAELQKINEWDGGGLHMPSDPGGNAAGRCFAYMEVKDGAFVRLFPKKVTAFECGGDDVIYDLEDDFGGGAKLPSS